MVDTNWDPGALSHADPAFLNRVPLSQTSYKVDIDAPGGAQIRYTAEGMAVYMLFRNPGIYLNDHGKRVPDVVAASAGYDVERLAKLRKLEEAKQSFARQMEAEFNTGQSHRVVAAADDYQIVECAPDLYNIVFVDGEDRTVLDVRGALSLEVASRRFTELTGGEVSALAEPSQPGDGDVEKGGPRKAK
jgi:hypothetical protein